MIHRAARAAFLVLPLLAATGCFATRAVGLGPDPGPDDIVKGDSAEVMYEKAQRLFAGQEWKAAADAFYQVWSTYPRSELAQDAQFYEADSRYGQGKYNGAFELYKHYLKDWPLSPHAPLIQRRIYDIGTYTIQTGRQGFLGIFDYASEGVEELDYLVSAFPHGDLADDALLYMADYEWRSHQPRQAIDHLHDLIDNYSTSEWALEARLRLAKAYRDINRGSRYDADALQRAAAEYRSFIELVTDDKAREQERQAQLESARAELADVEEQLARKRLDSAAFYLKAGNGAAARAELVNVLREFPNSEAAGDARRQLGFDVAAANEGGPAPKKEDRP